MPGPLTDNSSNVQSAGASEGASPSSDTWTPVVWKRLHFVITCVLVATLLAWVLEISYSSWFSVNIYMCLVLYKLIQVLRRPSRVPL